jgi:hypothetical protein
MVKRRWGGEGVEVGRGGGGECEQTERSGRWKIFIQIKYVDTDIL